MKVPLVVLFCAVFLVPMRGSAQEVVGFWKVDQVMVGDRDVTPVAKWFRINKDHTSQAGNGWSQNAVGTWTYDDQKAEFLTYDQAGKPDEFGAFHTSFKNGKMLWQRLEDGMKVVVTLSPATEMPMAPKDSIAGRWDLVSVIKDDQDITTDYDSKNQEEILIRWTGTYAKTNPDGTQSHGFWHMDPHAAEFHMIDWNRDVDFQAFDVSFDQDLVRMEPWKDRGMVYIYRRK